MNTAAPLSRIGKYRIEGILGEGAMGIVYRAFDADLDRRAAIKTIRKELLNGPDGRELLERFKREASAGMRLSHQHVVTVYEFGEEGDIAYIAMEFIDGKSLLQLNQQRPVWPLLDALELTHQLLVALDFFHERGVVHRDIKPANIMIDGANNLVVTDFGVARTESSELTLLGTVLGTPSYMSPEQITGVPVDGRSDLFSVGVVLYEMLTGNKPFRGQAITIAHNIVCEQHPDPSSLNSTLPPVIDRFFLRALAKQPENRFQTGAEFRKALSLMVHAILHGGDDVLRPHDATLLASAALAPLANKNAAVEPNPLSAASLPGKAAVEARPSVFAPAASKNIGGRHGSYQICPNCQTEFSKPRPWNAICSGCGMALLEAAQQAARPPSRWGLKILVLITVFATLIFLVAFLQKV
jgi:serine/threonine protein kinase